MTIKTQTEEQKNLARKIKALLAKTVEAGASEAEAMSAFTLAHRLLEQHQMSLSDLDLREEGTCHSVQSMDHIARRMSTLVGKYCECKVWMSDYQPVYKYVRIKNKEKKIFNGNEYTKINFIGIKSDCDFAEWLMAALAGYVQGREMSYMFGELCATAADAEDFVTGCIDRINKRLREEIDARKAKRVVSTGRDLVPLKNAMITEAFAKLGISLKKEDNLNFRVMNQDAYARGNAAGDGVTFNRPINRDSDNGPLLLK